MDLQRVILKLSKTELVDTLLNMVKDNILNAENADRYISNEEKKKTKAIKDFIPPTFQDVLQYCNERKNNIDVNRFYDYFTETKWIDSKGNKVKNWKGKIITWESYANKGTNQVKKEIKEISNGVFRL